MSQRHAPVPEGAPFVPGDAVADVHTHTRRSDGVLEPRELAAQAHAAGVRLLAITDHDNLAAYRELTAPIMRFVDELDARYENSVITVVLPEFVVGSWWGQLLHNQSALLLKARLLFRKGTVVTSVPYHLET